MNDFLYEELVGKGFDSSQINQLLSIAKNMDIYEVLLYIKPSTDVDVLRSLNIYLKNKERYDEWDFFDKILNLVKENISFQEIFDIPDAKLEYACELLMFENFDRANLKYLRCENIDDRFVSDVLMDDFKNGIDVSLYYREDFNRHHLYAAKDLVEKGLPELVDKILPIKATGVVFNDITYYKRAEDVGLDLIEILNKTKDSDITKKVINLKEKGIDITKYLDNLSYSDCTFYSAVVRNGLDDSQVSEIIKLGIKNINYDDLDKYMELYKNGVDIEPLIENHCDGQFISLILPLVDKVELAALAEQDDVTINLIYELIEFEREDLIDIFLNLTEPDEDTFYYISKILEKDKEEGTKHKIINLLYDKGADVFQDYDYCYEFDILQKRTLSYAMMVGTINEENIDLLRDNSMESAKMDILSEIISEGYDISVLLDKIEDLTTEEIEAAGTCLRCGFKLVVDDKTIEKK